MIYELAALPGDGIGPEVTTQARKVLNKAAQKLGFTIKWRDFPFGAAYYLAQGHVLPKGALDDIGSCQALLLGAVGDPRVPPGPLERELLLALRFHFDQYLNIRPAKSFPNVPLPRPLGPGEKLDIVVVRENTEDFYMGLGGLLGPQKTNHEIAATRKLYQFKASLTATLDPELNGTFSVGLLTEPAIRRIAKKAYSLAVARGDKIVHVATKANALPDFYGYWDRITRQEAENFPEIKAIHINVDNLCYQLPRDPNGFGVILCPNLFGDIVSDLVSALAGGLGLAASGNLGDGLAMFEPVHGSAPDIAGTGKANPLAAILSGALLLESLNLKAAANLVERAVVGYLAEGRNLPRELGGPATVERVGELVLAQMDQYEP
ncbi:MAG: isocitrate/isopropylmalate dehydrogenase family protein [Deltaproteobacteria bacterium]|jgi:3-isopropylmalate dehydrogenase|nr:isocitrate/isopropylmalate dehydrogenase family protein [Deltaproteobacteria bacterium]